MPSCWPIWVLGHVAVKPHGQQVLFPARQFVDVRPDSLYAKGCFQLRVVAAEQLAQVACVRIG